MSLFKTVPVKSPRCVSDWQRLAAESATAQAGTPCSGIEALAGGYKSAMEIGQALGREAATTALTSAVTLGTSSIGSSAAQISNSVLRVGAQTAIAGASSAINTVGSSFINSIDFSNGSFNSGNFMSSMGSLDTWKGTIATTIGAGVTSTLGAMNLGQQKAQMVDTGNGWQTKQLYYSKVDGFNSAQIGSISTLNSFAGSMASTAATYAMTGNATFNIASINGVGLYEVTVGNGGISGQVGMGGTQVSLGKIAGAMSGVSNWGKNRQIEKAAKGNGLANAATSLRVQWGFGDSVQKDQLESILNGSTKLAAGGTDGKAQTVIEDGIRTVHLAGYSGDMSREEQLAMGITMGHEAYRNGLDDGLRGQAVETINAVAGHAGIAYRMNGDNAYSASIAGILNSDELLGTDVSKYSDIIKAVKSGDKAALEAA